MKYGRFTNMNREDVQSYLESRGFAVYDKEHLGDLREAAYLDSVSSNRWSRATLRK
jgi:cysteinyl-tRNA synthetase